MIDSTEARLLFGDYVSGAISASQLEVLEVALRDSIKLRSDFIEYMNIDSALADLAALSEVELAELMNAKLNNEELRNAEIQSGKYKAAIEGRQSIANVEIRRARWYRAVACLSWLAASLIVVATLIGITNLGDDKQTRLAIVVAEVNAALTCDGLPHTNNALSRGLYHLDKGLVHLQFKNGVMIYVEAPAQFQVISTELIALQSGRLSASVPPEGIGFTVKTPEAEVVDFGTEFSVDVVEGASEVHVFEGRVRVQPHSSQGAKPGFAVDLRTSQALMIDNTTETPVEIELATNRFIRTFVESRRSYTRTVKELAPIAFYRMAIRDHGLNCIPATYSGIVLTGSGSRPAHASGVFAGGSLRVRADSIGRGGRVDLSPPLPTGYCTLSAFVYLEADAPRGVVAKNLQGEKGCFALALDELGLLQATVRTRDGELKTVSGETRISLQTWHHVVMTVDGERLSLYEDGRLVTSSPCSSLAESEDDVLWFGTDAKGEYLWDGRIDEVVLFDRSLSQAEVMSLYQAATEEIGKPK